ncbi:hypothetical protein RISK_005250 [Rhodopirellula islandica]|uniref:Methylamine utilization protein MauE n=1 Tax=Rhodopirellula islandica TaxID=595434 RepID=A0A0J1E9P4_RHOIS|nr:MauE/DoxX family redox-associated membrane protein [Rhodopirellula islandica]KLU02184.1 hypothetical protein RISK_005250 [Rhodopirellula islandica]
MLFDAGRICLSVLLMLTAALKMLGASAVLGSGGLLASPVRLSLAVGFEVFAAVLIAMAPPRFAHRFALLVFSALACIAAWAWLTQADCGCFGARTPKGVPLIVDLAVVGLLLCSRGLGQHQLREGFNLLRRHLFMPAGIAVTAGLLAAGGTMWQIERISSPNEIPTWFGDNLIGMWFPLLCDEKFAEAMPATGDALVVMLRPDCEHCREVAAEWESRNAGQRDALSVIGISVAEGRWTVMPNEVSPMPIGAGDEFVITWEDTEEPFIAAPTFIAVRDRIVVGVATGKDASELIETNDWIRKLFGAADE